MTDPTPGAQSYPNGEPVAHGHSRICGGCSMPSDDDTCRRCGSTLFLLPCEPPMFLLCGAEDCASALRIGVVVSVDGEEIDRYLKQQTDRHGWLPTSIEVPAHCSAECRAQAEGGAR